MFPFAATAPGLFGASTLCSPSICADVHATVRSRLEEGDVDGIVRSRFSSAKSAASAPAGPGSRLLLQMSEVRTMTGESDPLAALTSLLREVGELRELQNRLLQSTNQMSVEAALDSIEDAMRALTELKEAEKVMGATLGLDGWRAVAAEVEAARHLEARIRAFAGVHSKDGGSLEAALRTLQHRERERLSLIQLRNDVLGAAAQIAADNEAREAAGGEAAPAAEEGLKTEAGEPTRTSVKLVRELVEQAASMKALTRTASLTDALTSLKHTPSYAQHELETARRRLRRLHALLLTAARPRAVAAHLGALGTSGAAGGGDGAGGDGASALAFAPSAAPPAPSSRSADGASTRNGNGAAASTSRSADGAITSPCGSPITRSPRPEARPLGGGGGGGGGGALASAPEVLDEADDEVEEAEPQDDEETLTFGQRAWRRVGQHMALLTGAEAANAGGDAAIEIRARSTPKVPRLPLPPAPVRSACKCSPRRACARPLPTGTSATTAARSRQRHVRARGRSAIRFSQVVQQQGARNRARCEPTARCARRLGAAGEPPYKGQVGRHLAARLTSEALSHRAGTEAAAVQAPPAAASIVCLCAVGHHPCGRRRRWRGRHARRHHRLRRRLRRRRGGRTQPAVRRGGGRLRPSKCTGAR
jgi:hypothetical protein